MHDMRIFINHRNKEDYMNYQNIFLVTLGAVSVLLFSLTGCTTTDPYTREQVIDQNATAALVGGLALGAAAGYAVSDDDDDNDDNNEHGNHHHHRREDQRDRSYSPARGVICYDRQRSCFNEGDYSDRWTQRVNDR
jgi:hypothetical protein